MMKTGIITVLFFMIALVASAQTYRGTVCEETFFDPIRKAYYFGAFAKMDSMIRELMKSNCVNEEPDRTISALRLLQKRLVLDSYKKNESDSIETLITAINNRRPKRPPKSESSLVERYIIAGYSGSYFFGKNSNDRGFIAGYHSVDDGIGFGVDVGAGYHNWPFSISEVKNKDGNNNYVKDGHILKSSGYVSSNKLSLIGSLIVEDYDYNEFGFGIIVGLEAIQFKKIYLNDNYFETNYIDSVGSDNSHYLTFEVTEELDYYKNDFFTKKFVLSGLIGINVYWRPVKFIQATLSGFYAGSISGKLRVSGPNTKVPFEYGGARLTISWIFPFGGYAAKKN